MIGQGERDQSEGEAAAGGVLDQPERIRAEEPAQVAKRIDQGDAAGRRGA